MYRYFYIFLLAFIYAASVFAKDCKCLRGYADIIEPIMPAVVSITNMQKNEILSNSDNISNDHDYSSFFEPHHSDTDNDEIFSAGAGFIINQDGYIVTNYHVIANYDKIIVKTYDQQKYQAYIIGFDKLSDLAILKINSNKKFAIVKFNNDKDNARLGDQILAIGNPFGLGEAVSTGIISAKYRDNTNYIYDNFLQIDATINQGNSGGPLLDMNGKVIGIISSIYSPSSINTGVGFALPAYLVTPIINDIIKYGQFLRLDLGISLNSTINNHIIIDKIDKNSPLLNYDIKLGDIITNINSKNIYNITQAQKILSGTIGDITIKLQRDDTSRTINIKKNDYIKQNVKTSLNSKNEENFAGIIVENLNSATLKQFHLNQQNYGALVINLEKNNLASKNGLKIGDIIIAINNQHIYDAKDFKLTLDKLRKEKDFLPSILLKRDNTQIYLQLPLN